ncbi:MAG: sigma-54-dependent Fis family transcriptional regulator [Magnetococcales bacterium]|nr:sigma-54-dependent Fis family transcriptional regulator [Magnetococcales bacterium]
MLQNKTALIIEDDTSLLEFCQQTLKLNGWQVGIAKTGKDGMAQLRKNPPDVLLLDIFLPDLNGIDILETVFIERIPTIVVIMTGKGSINLAVEAMRIGAFDFFEKPVETERLLATMGNALRHKNISQQIIEYENNAKRVELQNIFGASLVMQTLFTIIDNVANSKASVFITGESGTGKELCAEAIHKQSSRKDKPFIVINCSAIPHNLMESEIFGHVQGAFSDAHFDRQGAASLADGGTLFLDEVCEMELELQSKLLRFVQSGLIKKVGDDKEEPVDIRFICASNKNPHQQVKNGLFRKDLFYRFYVVPIEVPPLRDRGEDILLLARKFLLKYAKKEKKQFRDISRDAANALLAYDWPGNVRELQNIIQQTVILHDSKKLKKESLPPPLSQTKNGKAVSLNANLNKNSATSIKPLIQTELDAIEYAIERCNGNIKLAATLLQIDQSTIYRKRKKLAQQKKS